LTSEQDTGRIYIIGLRREQLEGGFPEMPKGWSFGVGWPVRVTREKPPEMTDAGCHAQHTKVALYLHSNSSCSVAIALYGYFTMGINIGERR